jgi:HK97 family phage portal protein
MSLLTKLLERFEKRNYTEELIKERRKSLWNTSLTGVAITSDNALRASAVYACVRLLSESVAMLPLVLYRQNGRSKEKALDHPLYGLLHDAPNGEMTAFDYRQLLMVHLCLRGNAYSYIEYAPNGRIIGLWPLNPDSVQVMRDVRTGLLVYAVELPERFGKEYRFIAQENIWHLRGLGRDGIMGYSPIRLAREAIGLSLAAEGFGASFFANEAEPGFVLVHPGKLGDDAYKRLKSSWEERHRGFERAHRVAILEEGMKVEKIGISPDDAQFLETRKFQINEIARIFRVPPHMIGDLDRATFSNIEHMGLEFVTYTLMPWLVNIEQSISLNLLTETERKQFYAKHTVAGLLRGDIESRYRAYSVARQWGWMSVDDIRELEEMNPLPKGMGDKYLEPLNMSAVGVETERNLAQISERRDERRARAVKTRRKLMEEYGKVFSDAFARVYRRERNDLLNAAKKKIKINVNEFLNYLDEFYPEHREYIKKNMGKVMETYANLVADAATEEVGKDDYDRDAIKRYSDAYVERLAQRMEYYSRERITNAINIAQRSNNDVLEQLEEEMSDWDTTRAEFDASKESVRANGAITLFAFTTLGVAFITWVASGKENCPICDELDGKKIGISQKFVSAGDVLNQNGEPYHVRQDHAHPPLHDGCDCMIVAG